MMLTHLYWCILRPCSRNWALCTYRIKRPCAADAAIYCCNDWCNTAQVARHFTEKPSTCTASPPLFGHGCHTSPAWDAACLCPCTAVHGSSTAAPATTSRRLQHTAFLCPAVHLQCTTWSVCTRAKLTQPQPPPPSAATDAAGGRGREGVIRRMRFVLNEALSPKQPREAAQRHPRLPVCQGVHHSRLAGGTAGGRGRPRRRWVG